MQRALLLEGAELDLFKTPWGVALVLRRRIVAALALGAGQNHNLAWHFSDST